MSISNSSVTYEVIIEKIPGTRRILSTKRDCRWCHHSQTFWWRYLCLCGSVGSCVFDSTVAARMERDGTNKASGQRERCDIVLYNAEKLPW
jgi:hypothetical protein